MHFPSRTGLREILRLALPIIASMASATIASFIDTKLIAWVGTAEVAAGMPAGITAYALTALPLGITQCVSTFASQALGRNKPAEGAAFAWQGIYLSLIVGVAVFTLWPVASLFFTVFGHGQEIVALEVAYFRLRLWGVGLSVAVGALNGFFYGIHRPSIPMFAMIMANITNVAFAYLLIFGSFGAPALGLAGAAIAMVLSFVVQFAVLFNAFLSAPCHQEFSTRSTWRPAAARFRQLLHIGWPAGVQSAIDVLGWGVLIVLMVGQFGTDHLAASNIAIQYMTISFMPGFGLAQAITALVGRYIGEGKIELAVQRVYEGLFLALTYTAIMGILYVIFGGPFMRFFSTEPEVVRIGSSILLFAAAFQLFDGMNFTFSGALRGAGDTHWPTGLIIVLTVFFFAPLSMGTVMFTDLQSFGPWLAGTVYGILLGLGLWWRFAQGKWKQIDIFAAPEAAQKKGTVAKPSLSSLSD